MVTRIEQDKSPSLRGEAADRAEQHLRASDEQFQELMAHLEQVFWIKNAQDDAVLYVSPHYETVFGRTCQSLYDDFSSFVEAIHPEDRQRVVAAIEGQNLTGGYNEEYRIVRPDGTTRWIWVRSYSVRDAQGQLIRFAGIGEDVTERKALEKHKAELAAIVEYSEDAIVSMSVDCTIIAWNRGAERQYGYTAEEIIGCSLSVLFPPDHYGEYLQVLQKVRQGEPVSSCDTVRQRKDGSLIKTSVNIFPVEVRNHELVGASKISRDVTAMKKLEAQFIEAQKMEVVGQLAAGMAHDFNNLLFVILGCSELMLTDPCSGTHMLDRIETIRQAAARASGLTRQLLILSRRERAHPEVLDLNEVVTGLQAMLHQLVDDNIKLRVLLGSPLGRIQADSGHLGQVLLNLVINARDAMPDGGTLCIATSNATTSAAAAGSPEAETAFDSVRLTVSDTGTGISDDVRARLFEPFFTTKRQGKGTGLGLATCDTIVKQHGGRIEVSSVLGEGATFDVYFPALPGPMTQPLILQPPPGSLPRGTETLLLVEAERAVRDLASSVLESLGYRVLRAASGLEALRLVREPHPQPIRLVITDVSLSRWEAGAPIDWQTLVGCELKLLLTSEYEDEDVARRSPGSEFLPKPYKPSQLAFKVRAMLDES